MSKIYIRTIKKTFSVNLSAEFYENLPMHLVILFKDKQRPEEYFATCGEGDCNQCQSGHDL